MSTIRSRRRTLQLSVEEIRREQKLKLDAVELSQQLRTKAMRERDEVRAAAKFYRYSLVRIRLPDGLFLQAAFRPLEKLQAVREVVSSALVDGSLTFSLSAFGQPLKNDSETLAALSLVPSAVLNLSWNGAGPQSPDSRTWIPDCCRGSRDCETCEVTLHNFMSSLPQFIPHCANCNSVACCCFSFVVVVLAI
ncbi:UBX domain-containing protein 6 [Geodia barretti]|uniref:UBX domain-containing protein 6 n=1 Tax=Geodia barretti TaxID=519541 RepID=A0AA35U1P0_GEOBA|nr:UBX domain-containing protein 6 [Geodia barretti]